MSDQNLRIPVAFLSYARFNDQHDEDRITEFRKKLAGEIETITGDRFEIFQDRRDIRVGQQWKERIEQTLNSTTILIAVLSPSFFKSEYCRKEIEQFLDREARLGRSDLIVPVYYVPVPGFEQGAANRDGLVEVMKSRQLFDWTALRFADRDSREIRVAINALAVQIHEALGRFREPTVPGGSTARRHTSQPSDTRQARHSDQSYPPAEQMTQTDAVIDEPVAITQPPIRVVDGLRGPYYTLADALAAAKPGDRILVRPGTYDGGVVLDKPLEIIGENKPGEVVIQAVSTNALAFRTTLGRVANMTLKQLGSGGDYFAVDIVQGRLTLEGCHIESASLAGIAVHGADADPIIRNNRIRRCVQSGVVIFDNAQGMLEENDISENRAFGIVIRDGADPVVRSNQIHDNEYGGVNVNRGLGRLEGNIISGNRAEGVLIANEANPVLQRNKVFKNARAGIYVYDRGGAIVRENNIFENSNSGIAIRTEGNPIIQENSISGNNGKGVWCHDRAAGVVENNNLRENKFGAFWKSHDSTTRYVGNQE